MWSMRRIPLLAVGLTLAVSLLSVSAAHAATAPTQLTAPAAVVTPKQSVVTKIRATVTTFYTDAQLTKIVEKTAQDLYANKPIEQSFTTPLPLYAVTGSQQLALIQLTVNLTKDLGSTAVLDKTHAAFLRTAKPFYEQARVQVQKCRQAGKAQAVCLDVAYASIAQNLTKANVGKTLLDVKKSLTAKEWQSFRNRGAALVLWSSYGL